MLSKKSSAPWGLAAAALVMVLAAVLIINLEGTQPSGVGGLPASPTVAPATALRSVEPVARRIACGTKDREVGLTVPIGEGLQSGAGTVLGCSRDGTTLLVRQGLAGGLFVLHPDGMETQVAEGLSGGDVRGSARPAGATISPDGARVVFAGKVTRGRSCHHGALFAVDSDGGPAELLWQSQAAGEGGIVRYPTFSPDGTRIAFADGYCDSRHSVWVMNADGSDARQIVSDVDPLGATHVNGLAWSPAGDRIAIGVDQGVYTFASDGSGFGPAADAPEFCWPGRRC